MSDERAEQPGAYGAETPLTMVDRLGVWLSSRRLHASIDSFRAKRLGDFGCGYNATFVRSVLNDLSSAVLIDVSLSQDLKSHTKVCAVEGRLPESLTSVASRSLDIVLCVSVLEHLTEPFDLLVELERVTARGGSCLINVPNWLGKRFLEFAAFRLGVSPADSVDDHKAYYDPKDLWPLLVRAGFRPHGIRCYRHKMFLNTFAHCTVEL
jgi:2-polyprenyl-3-methyl-5-hydroxy-6-metoxy-1,4-benzoquinol methylase